MLEFSKNMMAYGTMEVLERIITLAFIPFLAQAILPSDMAIYMQSTMIAFTLAPILMLGLQTSLVKFYPRLQAKELVPVLSLVGLISLASVSCIIVGLFVNPSWMADIIWGDERLNIYIAGLSIFILSEVIFSYFVVYFRITNEIRTVALFGVLRSVLRLLCVGVLFYVFSASFWIAYQSLAFLQLLLVMLILLLYFPIKKFLTTPLHHGYHIIKPLYLYSVPLVLIAVMSGANNLLGRFFLTHINGLEDVGVFSLGYSLASILVIVYSVLGFVLFPELSRASADKQQDSFNRMVMNSVSFYLFWAIPFMIGLYIVGPDLLVHLSTDHYIISGPALLALGLGIFGIGLHQIFYYIVLLNSSRHIIIIFFLASILSHAILCMLLIEPYGILGASISFAFSYLLLASLTIIYSRRFIIPSIPWRCWFHICIKGLLVLFILQLVKHFHGFTDFSALIMVILFIITGYCLIDYCDHKYSCLRAFLFADKPSF